MFSLISFDRILFCFVLLSSFFSIDVSCDSEYFNLSVNLIFVLYFFSFVVFSSFEEVEDWWESFNLDSEFSVSFSLLSYDIVLVRGFFRGFDRDDGRGFIFIDMVFFRVACVRWGFFFFDIEIFEILLVFFIVRCFIDDIFVFFVILL